MSVDSHEERIAALLAQRGLTLPGGEGAAPLGDRSRGPLSRGQRRMWLAQTMRPDSAAYNVASAWRIEGDVDEPALVRALERLSLRHAALRTVFRTVGEAVEQVVLDDPPEVEIVELGGAASGRHDDDAALAAALAERAGMPFDLAQAPPVRLTLYRHPGLSWTLGVVLHHILVDDWSMGILRTDLAELYRSARTGGDAAGAAPGPSYLDWAQREHERRDEMLRQVSYWAERLRDAPRRMDLPVSGPPGDAPAAQVRVPARPAALGTLLDLGRAEGCSSFTVLLTVWAALLHRVTGEQDMVVGTPATLRDRTETHRMVGFFLNTFALRLAVPARASFRRLLAHTSEVLAEAHAHGAAPYDAVVEAVDPARQDVRDPLFQVWFAAEGEDGDPLELEGAACREFPAGNGAAKFDLALFATGTGDSTRLTLEYDASMFDRDEMERMADRLGRLADALAASPDTPLADHDLLDAAERDLVLRAWNDTGAAPSPAPLVHRWFERRAAAEPGRTALEQDGRRMTYGELDSLAEAVAHALRVASVRPGDFVAVAVRRSPAMVAAVLGVLKAGAAYVPLDLDHPAERLAMILEDTAVPVVLVDTHTRAALPPTAARFLDVAEACGRAPAVPGPAPRIPADAVAYVTYTSGSTGRPKGICMPHRAVSNLVGWQLERYTPVPPGQRTLQFASLSFDVSFQEIFSTFASGGTLVLISEDQRWDVHGLAELLTALRVERLFIPAAALQHMAEGHRTGGGLPDTLRTVISGSEQLVVTDALRRLFTDLPAGRLHNEYGPSETHVTTAHTLADDPAEWPAWAPIGRPVTGSRVYLLDAWGRPVPVGVTGEVCVGGVGLAHGYLRMPAATAAAFVPDPFSGEPGARLYRTGDQARYRPDGTLEFLGRADDQVKIRGYRVELGEVRTVLEEHPEVGSAFVRVWGERSADRRLVAYATPLPEANLDEEGLREYLRARLPAYMVPAAYVLLEKFPLTVNGKVDQKRLPEPRFGSARRGDAERVEPRDERERRVAHWFAAVLGADAVGRDEDFFRIGGSSLLVARLLTNIRDEFSVAVPFTGFFGDPTVAGLAGLVARAEAEEGSARDGAGAADEGAGPARLDTLLDELLDPAGDPGAKRHE
ncbi:non-ribosomal peptide synthetase [Streptomyces sp. CS227]|uniref:non-ribosomal peptide synthetase n=1 Tax=Streptomyces sp. CS227 TaxID=1982763 RepID=UPI0015C68553|nr:non-ribosomal peptide synthetase [Streptomyces sp. CS227]